MRLSFQEAHKVQQQIFEKEKYENKSWLEKR